MIKVEKNIRIPETSAKGRPSIYPFATMDVGDSFFLDGKAVASISPVAASHGQKYGKKFTCRTVEGGVRVWRIS